MAFPFGDVLRFPTRIIASDFEGTPQGTPRSMFHDSPP